MGHYLPSLHRGERRSYAGLHSLCHDIRKAVRTCVAPESGPGAEVSEAGLAALVRMALHAMGAVPTSAAFFDDSVSALARFASGPEVMCALALLLDIPAPPTGHMDKTLTGAEVSSLKK